MESVGVFEAKNHFSELLERVQRGEIVTITKHGKPVAQISPPEKSSQADPTALLQSLERAKADFLEKRGTVEPWALADLRKTRDERGLKVLD